MKHSCQHDGLKLVYVAWVDSHSGRGWNDLENIAAKAEFLHCRSVGWLISETKEVMVIVPHLTSGDGDIIVQGCGDITIPKCAIRKVKVIKVRGVQ